MQRIKKNHQQSQKIKAWLPHVSQEETSEDLLAFVQRICVGEERISYDNKTLMLAGGLSFVLCLLAGLWAFGWLSFLPAIPVGILYAVMGVGGLISIITLALYLRQSTLLSRLGSAIMQRALQLKYGYELGVALPNHLQSFPDLHRGNYSREIDMETKGVYHGHLRPLPYYFCHLHYVDEETRVVTDAKGRTRTQTIYHHYDRYYVFVKFPWVKGISVRSDEQRSIDQSVKYSAALDEFNRAFTATGNSEINAARFFKPATVLLLLRFRDLLTVPNLMFTKEGWLCMGFKNKDVITPNIASSLQDPEAFYNALKEGVAMPKMEKLFELIHELSERHDDNFNVNEFLSQ